MEIEKQQTDKDSVKLSTHHSSKAEIGIATITVLVGAVTWYIYRNLLFNLISDGSNESTEIAFLTLIGITAFLFVLYLSFVVILLLFSSKQVIYLTGVCLAFTPVVVFVGIAGPIVTSIIGIVYIVVLVLTMYIIKKLYINQVNFFLPGIIQTGTSILLLFLFIFISLLHFSAINQKESTVSELQGSLVDYTVSIVNLSMNRFKEYSSLMTIDEFIEMAWDKGSIGVDNSSKKTLNSFIDTEVIASIFFLNKKDATRNEFLKGLALKKRKFIGEVTMEEVWAEYVFLKSEPYFEKYERYIPAVISFGILLVLLFLSKIFKGLILLVTWLIISVLKILTVLKYSQTSISVKRLHY